MKGLETTTCEEQLKLLRMFTLGSTNFKRNMIAFFQNTEKNYLMEEGLGLVNAVLEDTMRAKEGKLKLELFII